MTDRDAQVGTTQDDRPEGSGTIASPTAVHPRRRWLQKYLRADVSVAVASIGAAGVANVVGLANISWIWSLAAGATLAAMLIFIVRALEEKNDLHKKVASLWAALAIALTVPVAAFLYHKLETRSNDAHTYTVIVNGTDVQLLRPVAEPGGEQFFVLPPLIGSSAHEVDCRVKLPDGSEWLRLPEDGGWVPQNAVHWPAGLPALPVPACRS